MPSRDTKSICPSNTRQSSLTIANPRPGPGISSPAARSNSSNTRSESEGAIPTPVSDTRIDQCCAPAVAKASSISPEVVYFVALDSRLTAICFSLRRLEVTPDSAGSKAVRNVILFASMPDATT